MKTTKSYKLIAAFTALTLAILACGGGGGSPTTPPTKAPPPTKAEEPTEAVSTSDVEVVNLTTYKDSLDYFHVVGEIHNGTQKALTSIELTIAIKDADGKSLLKDDSDNVVDT